MDIDNPNLNNATHDRLEWLAAMKKEKQAEIEQFEAEKRMEANNGFEDFSKEMTAAADWTEAQWDEFTAKVSKWWNSFEIKADETI